MIADAAATLRRRWTAGGYALLAMQLRDREIIEALTELWAETPNSSLVAESLAVEPEPVLGLTCDIRGG